MDAVGGDPLVGCELRAGPGDGDADRVVEPLGLGLAQRILVRHDEGRELAVAFEHGGLGDQRARGKRGLDLLGTDILAARQHDHVLDAPGDRQRAVGLDAAEIAGPEPTVLGERRPGGPAVRKIAGEDVRAADLHLADPLAVGIGDAQFAALDRLALGADPAGAEPVVGGDRRGLDQPVPGEHLEAEAFEPPGNPLVEPGAAGDRHPQPGREAAAHRPHEPPADARAAIAGDRRG